MANKSELNLEIADSKQVAYFLGKLFDVLALSDDKEDIDTACINIGRLIYGLVLLDRISFKIDEPHITRNNPPKDVELKFH